MAFINGKEVHFVSDLPELLAQWDFEKNIGVDPSTVPVRSTFKRWFRCPKCKHSQLSSPNNKTLHKRVGGCRACNGQVVCNYDQCNSFGKVYPDLVQYWDNERNSDTPYDVTSGSGSKRWFRCKVCGRVHQKHVYLFPLLEGCEKCVTQMHTSFGEFALAYYIRKCGLDVVQNDFSLLDGYELDIVIPSRKIAIEYDGSIYHKQERAMIRGKEKYDMCKRIGYTLIRVCEHQKSENVDESDICDEFVEFVSNPNRVTIVGAIKRVLNILGVDCDVDIARDHQTINEPRMRYRVENSIENNERMLSLWNHEKNAISPRAVSVNCSSEKYWFRCPRCGGDWFMTPSHVFDRNGCWKCCSSIQGSKIEEWTEDHSVLIKTWMSIRLAAKELGLSISGVRAAVRGKRGYGMGHRYGGRYWVLASDDAK